MIVTRYLFAREFVRRHLVVFGKVPTAAGVSRVLPLRRTPDPQRDAEININWLKIIRGYKRA